MVNVGAVAGGVVAGVLAIAVRASTDCNCVGYVEATEAVWIQGHE